MRSARNVSGIRVFVVAVLALAFALGAGAQEPGERPPTLLVDLAATTPGNADMTRVLGVGGELRLGIFGAPVAGGFDVDGDGHNDTAVGYMTGSPRDFLAGEAYLVFGNGTLGETLPAAPGPRVLRILGDVGFENTGSELWMGDVTGDGLGDLVICRQNHTFGSRVGAGAITVVVGSPAVAALAATSGVLDLRNPDPSIELFTVIGAQPSARLGIWARIADVDGDGTDDLIAAADQESTPPVTHHGAVYVIRGGGHLAASATLDLASFGATPFAGSVARITPPAGSHEFHFGSTCQAGDLDGNGRAEVFASAALNRAGASLGPSGFGAHAIGGTPDGDLFVVWDDAFPAGAWPAGLEIEIDAVPGSVTRIRGGAENDTFGEEVLGGLDYNGDGKAELFVGDIVADPENRTNAGAGYAFFRAETLKGLDFNVDALPPGVRMTKIIGPEIGAIGSDTVAHADFDQDGFDDLMIGSPTAKPQGRVRAGALHVIFGRPGLWPAVLDTASGEFVPQESLRSTEVQGAFGSQPGDTGDTLCYSATTGDIDGDGHPDLIVNEMTGKGTGPSSNDVGNLIILSGQLLSPPAHPGN